MIRVKLEDGRIVEFPDDTPESLIKEKLQELTAPSEPDLSAGEIPRPPEEEMEDVEREMPRFSPTRQRGRYAGRTQQEPEEEESISYTPETVLQDEEAMSVIRDYMYDFKGTSPQTSDEELVDQYLAQMRKFAAGQSVVTLNELNQLRKSDEDKLATAGKAYDVFDNFEGVFSEDYTWGETLGGLGTYARAAIVDPLNLAGLGLGRLIAGSSAKAGSVALRNLAAEAAQRSIMNTLTSKVGEKAGQRILTEGAKTAAERRALGAAEQTARVAQREVMSRASRGSAVSTALRSQAKKEVAIAAGVDTATALGVDYAYQQGMILTGRQEDWSPFQSGVTALGSLGAGFLTAGLQTSNRAVGGQTSRVLDAYEGYDFAAGEARNVGERLAKDPNFVSDIGDTFTKFSERVASGRAVTEEGELLRGVNEQEFFRYLMLGNEDMGVKGLAQKFVEAGVETPRPRYVGDNITSFMADSLENLPKEQKDEFVSLFRENVGKHLPDYENASMKDIADLMAYQTSVAGQQLNIFSQVARVLGTDRLDDAGRLADDVTLDEAMDALTPNVGRTLFEQKASEKPRSIDYYQNMLIQTIVSNPATTALNIKGSLVRGAYDTTADLVQGALYTGIGMTGLVKNQPDLMRKGLKMMGAATRRPTRLLAPDATKAEAEDYMAIRPEVEETLFRYLSGGVENEDVLRVFNMNQAGALNRGAARALNTYKDFTQKLYLVQAQDQIFKTQNFMYALDKRIAQEYGQSYSEFMARSDVTSIMNTPRYGAVELSAVDDAMRSVFSRSFSKRGSKNPMEYAATVIEDVRKIPIVGAALPFGQFFNGTVDFMGDYTGAKFMYRFAGGGKGMSLDSLTESFTRGAVGFAAVAALSEQELGLLDLGLSWDEQIDDDGSIITKALDYPESFFKMLGRGVAHYRRDGSVPRDLRDEFLKTFGPDAFTRNIQQSGSEIADSLRIFAEGDLSRAAAEFAQAATTEVAASWLSGYTRPLDPINQLAGLAREEGTLAIDRKQGSRVLNESFRYVDQVFGDVLMSLGSEEAYDAFQEERQGDVAGKIFGYRTTPAQSATQKMMNAIDRPEWEANFRTGNEKVDNRLNEMMFRQIEPLAVRAVNNPNWEDLSFEGRKKRVELVLNTARERTRRALSLSPLVEDGRIDAMSDVLRKLNRSDIDRAMDYLGMEKELDEYNSAQIRSILTTADMLERGDIREPYE